MLDRLTEPDSVGAPASASPWKDLELGRDPANDQRAGQNLEATSMWLSHFATGPRPFEDALAWFWHGHFAVSAAVVRHLPAMLGHLELLRVRALGNFREMIRAVTVDAAMLVFLDGATSTGSSPNENYGRELQELYTLGIGNYTEADVRAAAVALTGYVVRRRVDWEVRFVSQRHDSTPQILLGADGIRDVDTVVDAVLDHPAVPVRIAGKMVSHFLGSASPSLVDEMATVFADSALEIAPLGRAVLEAGLAGEGAPVVLAPVPWLVQVMRSTGAAVEPRAVVAMLRNMGQVPGLPPNVGGYPGASAWLSSSSTAARFSSAGVIATRTPDDAPVLDAAAGGRWDDLADLLVRPEGFTRPTIAALRDVSRESGRRPGVGRLALALAAPDMLIA